MIFIRISKNKEYSWEGKQICASQKDFYSQEKLKIEKQKKKQKNVYLFLLSVVLSMHIETHTRAVNNVRANQFTPLRPRINTIFKI